MYKVTIQAKTMNGLKAKVVSFLAGMDDSTVGQTSSQESLIGDRAARLETFATAGYEVPEKVAARPTGLETLEPKPISVAAVNPFTQVANEIRNRGATPEAAPVLQRTVNEYGQDTAGLPWDERIHSATQGVNKDGTWRYRRGIEDDKIKAVEKELRGVATPTLQATPPTIPAAIHTPTPPTPIQPVVVPVVAPPMPPPMQAVPSAHTFDTFRKTLVPTLAKLINEKKLNQEYVNQLCEHYKVDMLHKVTDAQLEEIFNGFVQYGMITKAQ